MKTKRISIIAVCLFLASYCLADRTTLQGVTENWLQGNTSASTDGRPGIQPGDNPPPDPQTPGPVGDSVWLLVGMGAVYAFCCCSTTTQRRD